MLRRSFRRCAAPAAPATLRAASGDRRPCPLNFTKILHDPQMLAARGYIMTVHQAGVPTVVKFVNMLLKNGLDVVQGSTF